MSVASIVLIGSLSRANFPIPRKWVKPLPQQARLLQGMGFLIAL
jgi:hypothetical protein